jgi:hypothetical protein
MFLRNATNAVMKGTQIFFIKEAIPKSIRRLRFSRLPELASALRSSGISTVNDLVGVSRERAHQRSRRDASDPPSPRLRRGRHRTRRDRGNGAFGGSDIEHVAIEGMELLGKAT